MPLKQVNYRDLAFNPFTMISDEWMLLTAGKNPADFNTMTVSWGHLGAIWGHGGGKPTAVVYVRPQRYTKQFIDREDFFSLCVFDQKYKNDLKYLGTHSGKDQNKLTNTSLTPIYADNTTYFEQAKLVFVCKKIYTSHIEENGFIDKTILPDHYPKKDFHSTYIGEIIKVMQSCD